jgi:hypothetical protein
MSQPSSEKNSLDPKIMAPLNEQSMAPKTLEEMTEVIGQGIDLKAYLKAESEPDSVKKILELINKDPQIHQAATRLYDGISAENQKIATSQDASKPEKLPDIQQQNGGRDV